MHIIQVIFTRTAFEVLARTRKAGPRLLAGLRVIGVPLALAGCALLGSAYVLGMFFNSKIPYYQSTIRKHCGAPLPNVMHLHTEVFSAGTQAALTLRLSSFDFETICTAVDIVTSSRDVKVYVTGRDTVNSSNNEQTKLLSNAEKYAHDAHYTASTAVLPDQVTDVLGVRALTNIELHFPPWPWSGFSKKELF
jgi:hypothetical protein